MITSSGLGSSRCLPIRYIRHHAFTYAHHAFFYFTSITTLGMNYGYKSRTKSAPSSYRRRTYGSGSYSKKFGTVQKTRRLKSFKPRFATVGFTRDMETKYADKAIASTGGTLSKAQGANGWFLTSTTWRAVNFGGDTAGTVTQGQQDLLKGVIQGTTATTRIGNKIRVKELKLKVSFAAAQVVNATTGFENAQYGESVLDETANQLSQYLRTTYRLLVVKDLQVNSAENEIEYSDVMESTAATGFAGVHSELKVANMGRFRIMTDRLFNLDADDPMKTISLNYYDIGDVRYNGTETSAAVPALTNNGIYVVWAMWTQGAVGITAGAGGPTLLGSAVNVSRRLCFQDA